MENAYPTLRQAVAQHLADPYHDLNHFVSGYGNDAIGEAEIGAWELASGSAEPSLAN